ncbi:MAG TPA: DNA-formamidopyrimidine glycosylase family protein, partial [Savagea sp.]
MPELPEVELVVRDLVKELNHERIERVEISDVVIASKLEGKEAIVKTLDVPTFIREMEGMQIESITRRSKYIYMTLS